MNQSTVKHQAEQYELLSLKLAVGDSTYHSVLNSLADAIDAAEKRVNDAIATNDADWADYVRDDEADVVEAIVGAMFVVCQAQINAIAHRASRLRSAVIGNGGTFSAFGSTRHDVLALGAVLPSAGNTPRVELIWAFANYFKHADEWDDPVWSNLKGLQGRTASVITRAGLKAGSTGNLRVGAAALGNDSLADVLVFVEAINEWSGRVLQECERAVSR